MPAPPGPDWCVPSGFSPRSPAPSPRGHFMDFQRQPKPPFERTSGDSNVSTTSALDVDAFCSPPGHVSAGADGFVGGGLGSRFCSPAGAGQHAGQWGASPPRAVDPRSMTSMHSGIPGVPGHSIQGSQWHQADVGSFVPQPESGGGALDQRRASAWHDINASFVV